MVLRRAPVLRRAIDMQRRTTNLHSRSATRAHARATSMHNLLSTTGVSRILIGAATVLCGCSGGGGGGNSAHAPVTPSLSGPAGNVLVIVADDVGTDMIGAYHQHPFAPPTPVIDSLAASESIT